MLNLNTEWIEWTLVCHVSLSCNADGWQQLNFDNVVMETIENKEIVWALPGGNVPGCHGKNAQWEMLKSWENKGVFKNVSMLYGDILFAVLGQTKLGESCSFM